MLEAAVDNRAQQLGLEQEVAETRRVDARVGAPPDSRREDIILARGGCDSQHRIEAPRAALLGWFWCVAVAEAESVFCLSLCSALSVLACGGPAARKQYQGAHPPHPPRLLLLSDSVALRRAAARQLGEVLLHP